MPANPRPLHERFEAWIENVNRRLRRLEARAAVLEGPNVVHYTGSIPAAYSSGQPSVLLASGVTIGPLPCLASYTPHAGDTVLLIPLGGSYVVAGTYS